MINRIKKAPWLIQGAFFRTGNHLEKSVFDKLDYA